eukprot:CAMPEP_0181252574 /NCGR_PEP_ID=MMETSP1096-20121128/47540_1 /TAXON_ID=156174 ORGANISM="Chrysochromulina ericina, Strain CCMP281" /NCGR_SAMPLE_ID=MMETSP1096 /ASSEMBLY_ACC=CAM_ASM_000453 /LENGTH=121 /DNA_ID=CAMNT_0023350347 /DNA_START=446 /DNA_END=811 /DNA_ORIENTATION=+
MTNSALYLVPAPSQREPIGAAYPGGRVLAVPSAERHPLPPSSISDASRWRLRGGICCTPRPEAPVNAPPAEIREAPIAPHASAAAAAGAPRPAPTAPDPPQQPLAPQSATLQPTQPGLRLL